MCYDIYFLETSYTLKHEVRKRKIKIYNNNCVERVSPFFFLLCYHLVNSIDRLKIKIN